MSEAHFPGSSGSVHRVGSCFQISHQSSVMYKDVPQACRDETAKGSVMAAMSPRDQEYHIILGYLDMALYSTWQR